MNLRDLKESVLTLPLDIVTEIHRAIRQSRRTSKRIIKEKAKVAKKEVSALDKLFKGMSLEDRQVLLAQLEKEVS
jgi:predicted translin family RNA/ssDNA-binding protein